MQQLYEERVRQIDILYKDMTDKQEALKKEAWNEYLADFSNQFQAVLQRHQDF